MTKPLLSDERISQLWDAHVVSVFGKSGINPIVFGRAVESAVLSALQAAEPVAWLWKYIGQDPYPAAANPDGLVARGMHEMDPHNPPYPEAWKPVGPLYAAPQAPAEPAQDGDGLTDTALLDFLESQQDVMWQDHSGQWCGGNGPSVREAIRVALSTQAQPAPAAAMQLAAALGWPEGISAEPQWSDLLREVARLRVAQPAQQAETQSNGDGNG